MHSIYILYTLVHSCYILFYFVFYMTILNKMYEIEYISKIEYVMLYLLYYNYDYTYNSIL